MSYIGQGLPADVFAGFTIDKFTGTGVASQALTLTKAPLGETALLVNIDGVVQEPTDDFTVSGTTVTIVGTAPLNSEINVTHLSGTVPNTLASAVDVNGLSDGIILDADADTTISADTDDQIDIKVGGSDIATLTTSSLTLKNSATADNSTFTLNLQTAESDIAADDVIGKIAFAAPSEGTGTDANLTAAAIQARSEGDFSSSSNATELQFMTGASEAATTKMTLTSSGSLGIGTSSPEQPLHIKSTAGVRMERFQAGSGGANIDIRKSRNATVGSHTILQSGDAIGGLIFRGSDGTEYENAAAIIASVGGTPGTNDMPGMLSFSTTADGANSYTERMRIESTGQVAVLRSGQGTFFDTAHKVIAELPSDDYAFLASQNQTAGAGPHYFAKLFTNGQSLVGSITVSNTGSAFNTSSDYRLKENVETDWNATTRLKQLKPSRFNFKADADTTLDGFLAHEVSSIVPEAITGDKDAVDSNGNPEYQGIDQSKLVPLMVKTIQELEARIKTLEDA